jgi:cobalt-zinc-cadmium efflux system outer membrane protein
MACYRLHAAQFRHSYLELKVANALKMAYLDVCKAQELLSIAVEQKATSIEVNEAVRAKSENGKVSALEIKKSMLGLANSELALQKAHTNLEISREKLASFWCGSCSDFDGLDFPYYDFECPPSLEECVSDNCHHPLLLKTQFDQLSAEEEVKLEKAQRFPNLIVTAGYKTLHNTHDRGMVLGIAFPLNIFDRNQGNVCRSEAAHCQAFNQCLDVQIALQTRLSGLHKQVMQSYSELMQIKTIILKLADEAYQMTLEGYNAGKFEYLDLLDAQKSLFEAKEHYIEALAQFFKKQTDIEYLTIQEL